MRVSLKRSSGRRRRLNEIVNNGVKMYACAKRKRETRSARSRNLADPLSRRMSHNAKREKKKLKRRKAKRIVPRVFAFLRSSGERVYSVMCFAGLGATFVGEGEVDARGVCEFWAEIRERAE